MEINAVVAKEEKCAVVVANGGKIADGTKEKQNMQFCCKKRKKHSLSLQKETQKEKEK